MLRTIQKKISWAKVLILTVYKRCEYLNSNKKVFISLFLGIAVIINNMKFFKVANDHESKEMPDRTGTDLDAGQSLSHSHWGFYLNEFTCTCT